MRYKVKIVKDNEWEVSKDGTGLYWGSLSDCESYIRLNEAGYMNGESSNEISREEINRTIHFARYAMQNPCPPYPDSLQTLGSIYHDWQKERPDEAK